MAKADLVGPTDRAQTRAGALTSVPAGRVTAPWLAEETMAAYLAKAPVR